MGKINVAELLKGCPSGMELDCAMYENVYFNQIYEIETCLYSIGCYTIVDGIRTSINFTKFGEFNTHMNSKCVIFPKGKTTWEGFQIPFKDGDIVATDSGSVFILKSCLEDNIHYHSYIGVTCCNEIQEKQIPFAYKYVCHLATEEEKAKLFDAIKDNGYKWNPETKILEILPKFNVGDTITNGKTSITIGYIDNEYYYEISRNIANRLFIKFQDEWNLISDKFPNKFNINTLKPFDSRVLVRNDEKQYWIPSFWGCKRSDGYTTTFGWCKYCIPYEGNEHLLETNNDCNEFYKTWKN